MVLAVVRAWVGRLARSLMVALLMIVGLAWGPGAHALDPALDVSQCAHAAWRIREGFTKGAIFAIAQTPDGYLWLGTELGLYRFDGVRALQWLPPNGEQLPSNVITSLLVARDGTLWIATLKGLASWKNGRLTQYPETGRQMVAHLLEDREGTVWFGVYAPGRLCAVQGARIECSGAGSFGQGVEALYEDQKGNLWVPDEVGLWRWAPGAPQRYMFPHRGLQVRSLIEDDEGGLLMGTSEGLKRLVRGKIQDYALPGVTGQFRPVHFFRSRDGSLWVGTHQGLLHLHQGKTDTFGVADGLSGDAVADIFEDREGSVWVSTIDGLDRFREYAVQRISWNQGLSTSDAYAVQATADGTIWIGTSNGLNQWQNGQLTVYDRRSAPRQSGRGDEQKLRLSGATREIANSGFAGTPASLGLDDQGRLWASSSDGVFYFERDRFKRVPGVAGGNIFGIATERSGTVWISNGKLGLFYLPPGDAVQTIPWSRLGHKGFGARALLADRLHGGVWFGFYEGGLFYFKDSQVRASYSGDDGLGNGRVNQLRFGSLDGLWAATEGGLSRMKDGHVATLTSKNGLPCDEVHWSVEDEDHFVWVYMPCGLARIAPSEWHAWASNPRRPVQTTIYDSSDGVRSVGVYGSFGPHVTQSPDGKIWFLDSEGVSVIDPRHLPYNKAPPPVYIEQITADRKSYDPAAYGNGHMRLPARTRDLQIDYAALSFAAPEKVRFRYKLEGRDRDWQDSGNRRQAFYTDLPPRNYRFRVTACNNSGVWNEAGTFLDFSVAPAYYQTTWFRLSCVAAFLALLWALYRLRLRQVAQQFNMRLEERVGERTRIARDLHDTLLQSFQGLLLRFQAATNLLPPGEAKERFEGAIDQAAQAITEGRDAVQGLRSSTKVTNDLALAISALSEELGCGETNPNCAEFDVEVEGTPRNLHPILRDEVYRIAGEAVRNAFKHAQAERVEVEIRYDERQLRLRVRDDGKGIDAKLLNEGGRAGHYGMRGMRERAKLMGGKLAVWSELGSGTEVELRIPASRAYETAPGRRRSWLAEKLLGKETEMKS
jgi:signal transduction histidine kinase/ligand-binding sensor domain-containing protein